MDARILDFDQNATTRVDSEVLRVMLPFLAERGANPSSTHAAGRLARVALDRAREALASLVEARPDEIVFTAGGTEANNLAILGAARSAGRRGGTLVATAVEHPSVLGPLGRLRDEGFRVELLPVDVDGRVDPECAIGEDTLLVSVMAANNETGALQPIDRIADRLPPTVLLHCDATQVLGKAPLGRWRRRANLISLSSHKIHGPPGAGALVVRAPLRLTPLAFGGGQERGLRPGSENVAALVGFATAAVVFAGRVAAYERSVGATTATLLAELRRRIPECRLNGPADPRDRLPNTLNVSFPVPDGRALLIALDHAGILASGGSACASGATEPSHVLVAMGRTREEALRSVRFSLGRDSSEADATEAAERVEEVVRRLQGPASP